MSMEELKDKYDDILALALFHTEKNEYIEDTGMESFISRENLSKLLSKMEELQMDEMMAAGKEWTLIVLKVAPQKALVCAASSRRPFAYWREILHLIAKELQ